MFKESGIGLNTIFFFNTQLFDTWMKFNEFDEFFQNISIRFVIGTSADWE